MTPEEEEIIRARQKSRSLVTGLLLGFFVILFFAITLAKIGTSDTLWWPRYRRPPSTATGVTAGPC